MATPAADTYHLQTQARSERPNPTLLFARKSIDLAFHAARVTRGGEPTEAAREAVDWIQAHTDWTGKPIPPLELRRQFYGSFEWCCVLLNIDPDHVRRFGLPPVKDRNGNSSRGGG